MITAKRIHCLADLEPQTYHAADANNPLVYAINLNFECEADATDPGDEGAGRALFGDFLGVIENLDFHIYALVPDDMAHANLTYVDTVTPLPGNPGGDGADIIAWLDRCAGPAPFWIERPRDPQVPVEEAIDEARTRATHLLRGSHAWSAPVPHAFGLTQLIRTGANWDVATSHVVVPSPRNAPPPAITEAFLEPSTGGTQLWRMEFDFGDPRDRSSAGSTLPNRYPPRRRC